MQCVSLGTRCLCPGGRAAWAAARSSPGPALVPSVRIFTSDRHLVVSQASFDDDPNSEPSTSSGEGGASSRARPRFKASSLKKNRGAAGQDGAEGKKGQGKRRGKPTPEQLKAMGYDDVDDFQEEEDAQPADPLYLRENDPMYTPALTDADLESDPPDHRSGYVAVIGKPNAGKSTLINALVGQKLSIVSYKPQTTRHRIMGITSDKNYQMVLFDTPGIIERKRTKLEERMMAAVVNSIQNSEAIIAVVDAADLPKEALAMFQPGSNWTGPPMAVLLNKADLVPPETVEELKTWYKENCRAKEVFVGSALNKDGVQQLKAWAVEQLPLGPTLYNKDMVSEQPEKFFVAELIREKIFFMYQQEIPYSVQVHIAEFKERPRPMKDYINAQILVERETQVGIVIGRNGAMLKQLGQEARQEIETFLGRPVYLELGVQCSDKWRESKDALERFGYFDPFFV